MEIKEKRISKKAAQELIEKHNLKEHFSYGDFCTQTQDYIGYENDNPDYPIKINYKSKTYGKRRSYFLCTEIN